MMERLPEFNVVWDSPSPDASGSMPLGNGDLALNVWLEPSGDLLLLIAKSDAWDENSINLKLGRIRIRLLPNPFLAGAPFRQTLHLKTAEIEIAAATARLRIWVDANHPAIHIEASSQVPIEIEAALEMWRTEPRQIQTQTSDMFKNLAGKNSDPYPTIVWPDRLINDQSHSITWCHHNEKRVPDPFEVNLRLQGLAAMQERMLHPLLGRTFGATMLGPDFIRTGPQTLRSKSPGLRHLLNIFSLTLHPTTPDEWRRELDARVSTIQQINPSASRKDHEQWWHDFWNRSWIYL
ncbi:MAG TPA: DUF5703 domain-containing protein, partial [Tepidisphaeraceae bacterium]